MRHTILAAAAVLTGFSLQAAQAQTTIIERDVPDRVIVERPAPESRTVETRESPDGCRSKTVTKETEEGDRTTVRKESCD